MNQKQSISEGKRRNLHTPEEKYFHDPAYARMVDILEMLIREGQFTPSELREMVIFACTRYELHRKDWRPRP